MRADKILILMNVIDSIVNIKNLMEVEVVVNNNEVLAMKIHDFIIAIKDPRE